MGLFFEEPARNFYLREISRLTGIAVMSARKYLIELEKEGLLLKDKSTLYPSYKAKDTSTLFRAYKQHAMILFIHQSGLIDYLEKATLPRCIILFGSVRKGEYTKKSDIDIFIQAPKQELGLAKFERILKHKISILFEPDLTKLNEELLNNLINGIVLYGNLRIRGQKWQEKK
ncbi:MAG: nucleotidyltransferase domain-containing protein [Candidatus Nanoarchaeia archaeon]|nr:nucleotidyltransferase domain-containing protein [Candidatus Nanoarchaeia archaeon]